MDVYTLYMDVQVGITIFQHCFSISFDGRNYMEFEFGVIEISCVLYQRDICLHLKLQSAALLYTLCCTRKAYDCVYRCI